MEYRSELQLLFPWFDDVLVLFREEMAERLSDEPNALYEKLKELTETFCADLEQVLKDRQ